MAKGSSQESEMIFNSIFYCPSCTDGGDLFVKDTDAYFKEKSYNYYCKKCKATFNIKEIEE